MKKVVVYEIEFCNSKCPHFYHKFYDLENIWCALLNKKIRGFGEHDFFWHDYTEHPIPEECPLEFLK